MRFCDPDVIKIFKSQGGQGQEFLDSLKERCLL
jgi:hypothetical protein